MRWRSGAPSGEHGYSSKFCRRCPDRRGGRLCDECPEHDLQLLPENQRAADIFLKIRRQWRTDPMTGRLLGLDMPGVQATLTLANITLDEDDLTKLQIMEGLCLDIDEEARETSKGAG